jgi:hypothetical protein
VFEGRKSGLETLITVEGEKVKKINLPPFDPALLLINHIRDESHRFAIKNHRKKRAKKRTKSSLESIKGISYIMERKKQGCQIVLATASHKNYAFAVAKHLKIFDDVMATNKDFNLSSQNKADTLVERFGEKNFDYMGDHMRDLPVWEVSRLSIIVNATNRIISSTKHLKTLVLSNKS